MTLVTGNKMVPGNGCNQPKKIGLKTLDLGRTRQAVPTPL